MIKNWLQFIKESKQLELFTDEGIFPYTEEDIMDYLLELEDAGYEIEIETGFLDSDNKFTRKIDNLVTNPVIRIQIFDPPYKKISDEDVTSCVTSFVKRVSKKAKDVRISDDEGKLDIKYLKFQGGIFLNESPEDSEPDLNGNYHDIQLDNSVIYIDAIFNRRSLSYKEVLNYYDIKGSTIYHSQGSINTLSYLDDGEVVVEVEVEDLARWCVSRSDSYVKYVTNHEAIWDWYVGYFGDTPDHQSFFQYNLTEENIRLLLQVCIKLDGWEEIRQNLKNSEITEEEFLKEAPKDWKKYSELGKIIQNLAVSEEVYNEIRGDYVSLEESTKAQEDLDEIISKFDILIEKQLKTKIIKKNKYIGMSVKTNKNGEKYNHHFEFETYQLKFNFDWFEDLDVEEIHSRGNIYNLLCSFSEIICVEDINPRFSDYASVDDKSFNIEVKSKLERILEKN